MIQALSLSLVDIGIGEFRSGLDHVLVCGIPVQLIDGLKLVGWVVGSAVIREWKNIEVAAENDPG